MIARIRFSAAAWKKKVRVRNSAGLSEEGMCKNWPFSFCAACCESADAVLLRRAARGQIRSLQPHQHKNCATAVAGVLRENV